MILRLSLLALVLMPFSASAAERAYSIGSFDRVRVEGPFDVRLTTAQSPRARAEGPTRSIEGLDIRVEGTTLIVRAGINGWGEQPVAGNQGAPVIIVSTSAIRNAIVLGGGRLSITGPLRGQRIELSVTGNGTIDAGAIDADLFTAAMYGSGTMKLGGRGAKVRLVANGTGGIDATALSAGDLTLLLDGPGQVQATARSTANVTSTGIGAVTVYGKPACTVKAAGPVSCGKLPAP